MEKMQKEKLANRNCSHLRDFQISLELAKLDLKSSNYNDYQWFTKVMEPPPPPCRQLRLTEIG